MLKLEQPLGVQSIWRQGEGGREGGKGAQFKAGHLSITATVGGLRGGRGEGEGEGDHYFTVHMWQSQVEID